MIRSVTYTIWLRYIFYGGFEKEIYIEVTLPIHGWLYIAKCTYVIGRWACDVGMRPSVFCTGAGARVGWSSPSWNSVTREMSGKSLSPILVVDMGSTGHCLTLTGHWLQCNLQNILAWLYWLQISLNREEVNIHLSNNILYVA